VATRGTLYDGATAYPHGVTVTAAGDRLELVTDGGHRLNAPLATLVRTDEGERVRLGRSDLPGWRLVLDGKADADLARHLPARARYGRWIDRHGLAKAAIACGVVAAGVVALGYAAPHWVAPHVPIGWERNVGESIVGDFGDNRCTHAGGQQALEAMAERIEPGVTRGPNRIRFAALDVNILNAAAIPGNHIIVFKKMIRDGRSPEELAGVLAHEIAHVRRRHVTEALLRELGIGALIRLFAGGIGANAQQIVSLSYTRANEAEADADAIASLKRAGIDPRPTADLFRRLAGDRKDAGNFQWLESHPASGGRARLFAASYNPRVTYRPALSDVQASALYDACGQPSARRPKPRVRPAPAPR
jgi:hypothetical protein